MIVKKGSIYYVVVKYKNNNEEWKKKWIRAGTSRRDAQRLERKYESDRDAGIPIVDRNTSFTLREFFSQWLDSSIKPPSRSLGTYENYIYCADKVCAHIGNVRIDRLTPPPAPDQDVQGASFLRPWCNHRSYVPSCDPRRIE